MIEILGIFISRHAAFFESYGNLVLLPLLVLVSVVFFIIRKRKLSRGYVKWSLLTVLLISNILMGSILFMINFPLKPMVHSLAKVQRSIGAYLEDFTYQGRVLLVNFWATYCGPCLEEFPELKKLEETYSGKVEVIALSDEDPDQILKVIQKLNTPSGIGYYTNGKWMNLESFRPVTVILDKDGIIREYKFGRNSLAQFREMVERYL
jgi:thiol-disulfide isomerase/thioredoxin